MQTASTIHPERWHTLAKPRQRYLPRALLLLIKGGYSTRITDRLHAYDSVMHSTLLLVYHLLAGVHTILRMFSLSLPLSPSQRKAQTQSLLPSLSLSHTHTPHSCSQSSSSPDRKVHTKPAAHLLIHLLLVNVRQHHHWAVEQRTIRLHTCKSHLQPQMRRHTTCSWHDIGPRAEKGTAVGCKRPGGSPWAHAPSFPINARGSQLAQSPIHSKLTTHARLHVTAISRSHGKRCPGTVHHCVLFPQPLTSCPLHLNTGLQPGRCRARTCFMTGSVCEFQLSSTVCCCSTTG